MVIVRKEIAKMTLEQFADQHSLTMEVREGAFPVGAPDRYYAFFADVEVKDGTMLVGLYGDGATEKDAIQNYANKISLKTLAFKAYTPDRKEIQVPRLVPAAE